MADKDGDSTMIEVIKAALQNQDLASAVGKIQDYFTQLDHVELNIAVTGESGSGKSTFINAFRGMGHEEDGSAPTGAVETTFEPKAYPHPKYPNVKMWDLPGIGTPDFMADKYLEEVQFNRYDFFIIVSAERFRECHAQLVTQIQKMGKKFYFLHAKIDCDIESEKWMKPKTFNKDRILDKIRQNCIKGLQKIGINSPVFLISCFDLGNYDFNLLQKTMEMELPDQKRHVLVLTLPNITVEINERKRKALQANIWKVAFLSGAVAVVPIPGLSAAVDVAILVKELRKYCEAFGVDDVSLQKLEDPSGVPMEELKAVLKSPLNNIITNEKVLINKELVTKLLISSSKIAEGLALESGLEYCASIIPVLGSILAGVMSFSVIHFMLQKCLKELADDSLKVLMMALQTSM